jgi:hypothetical protein
LIIFSPACCSGGDLNLPPFAFIRIALGLDLMGLPDAVLWEASQVALLGGRSEAETLYRMAARSAGGSHGEDAAGKEREVRAFGCSPIPVYLSTTREPHQSVVVADEEKARAAKERGNGLFKTRAYEEAAAEYAGSLLRLPLGDVALLLANRAACHLKSGVSLLLSNPLQFAVFLSYFLFKKRSPLTSALFTRPSSPAPP